MKTAKVKTREGDQEWALLHENNGLGVTETLPYKTYTVTHLNSGYCIRHSFLEAENAKGFMDSIATMHDWKAATLADFKDPNGMPELKKKVSANFELWQANEDADAEGV